MKSLSEVASEVLLKKKCEGIAKFKDGFEVGCIFSIQISRDTTIMGEITFMVKREKETFMKSLNTSFTLKGIASHHRQSVEVENCVITETIEKSYDNSQIRCKFVALKFVMSPEDRNSVPADPLILNFGLTNMEGIPNIQLETSIGKLVLFRDPQMEKYSTEMREHKEKTIITTSAEFHVKSDGSHKLLDLLEDAKAIIQDFLKVTSLAQERWHDCAYVCVDKAKNAMKINKLDDDTFLEVIHPKKTNDLQKLLVAENYPPANPEFILSAWKGYSRDTFERYGFDLALEWFIASRTHLGIPRKILDLQSALELLMDRFNTVESGESLLDVSTFESIRTKLDVILNAELNEKRMNPTVQDEIRNRLEEINHRSFLDKLKRMLNFWGIRYDDLELNLDEILQIRDEIVRTGIYTHSNKGSENTVKVYLGLLTLLTRLFLAALNFKSIYFDPNRNSQIEFSEVCSRVRSG